MSLLETLNADMKQAMKNKDKEALSVIRMVKSTVMNEEINLGHTLTTDDEFEKGNREDLAAGIRSELDVLSKYLPKQLSDDEVKAIIQEAITQTGATTPKDMGKVMGIVTPQVKGKADGKLVANLVKAALA